ncbi:tetratricopeptide repeat protein [Nocardioides rubriscoriae]|uniref:tetratricopeptide repeat protein n=1 Tax=Nocardioides rubriscoriae TaxID=642762 RepID=UPI0011E02FB0|nr:tetratricopeptide repeat protein [Nocardioides rubriscoriae]
MTQQPFTRRGAIDLSALKRPAAPPPSSGPGAGGAAPAGSYTVQVTAQTLQQVVEASMTAPVLMVVYSASQVPESATYAADVAALTERYEGRFLAGLVDLDTAPELGQALQITQVPVLLVLLDGRPVTQPIPGVVPSDELSALFNQLGQQLTQQGVTGRHQPQGAPAPAGAGDEPAVDPRYAAAEDALARNDIAAAVAEYKKLVDANPADHEAAAGLAMATILHRTQGVDPAAARAAADAAPADVDAQTLVADLDLSEGRVQEAFARLVELVRVTSDKERDRAREHLISQFAAVGHDDPLVLAARRNLASALF